MTGEVVEPLNREGRDIGGDREREVRFRIDQRGTGSTTVRGCKCGDFVVESLGDTASLLARTAARPRPAIQPPLAIADRKVAAC